MNAGIAQVADDEQRMRIDGVGMEEVILHAADDASEGGDVAAEHAVQVHAAQLVGHADRCAEDFHEQAMMARVLAELLVDQRYVGADEADRLGAHAAQAGILLKQHEQLQQSRRRALEHVRVRHFEVVVAHLEARVQRLRRAARCQDRLAEQLQEHLVQQAHVHDGAVVLLHQLLDGQREARVLVAEQLRQLDLVVEQQAVLASPGQHVQPEAHLPQEGLAGLQLAQLLAGQEAVRDQFIERVGAEMALRDPGDRLQVAQAPRARLDVRLEVVRGVEVAVVAVGLFPDLGLEEVVGGPQPVGGERAAHAGIQRLGAGQQPRLEQRRRDADVGQALALAVVDCAHAVADLETDVPQQRQEALDVGLPVVGLALRQQHHDVDVGAGMQLAAAVAADRDQREVRGEPAGMVHPGGAQHDVHEARPVADQFDDILVRREALAQQFGAPFQHLPEGCCRVVFGGQYGRRGGQVWPVAGLDQGVSARVQEAATAGGAARPACASAPSVSTSKPVSVTRIVCSHCADSD